MDATDHGPPDLSAALIAHVKASEGLRLHPYLDLAGWWTVGYGHKMPQGGEHVSIGPEQADAFLHADLLHAQDRALTLSPLLGYHIGPRLDAITDFCFNLGSGAYQASQLHYHVNKAEWDEAATECLKWCHAKIDGVMVELPGLKKRRQVEATWLRDG